MAAKKTAKKSAKKGVKKSAKHLAAIKSGSKKFHAFVKAQVKTGKTRKQAFAAWKTKKKTKPAKAAKKPAKAAKKPAKKAKKPAKRAARRSCCARCCKTPCTCRKTRGKKK